jgi:hypothetical protein
MALFNKLPAPDRSQTQLAYMLNYYPLDAIPAPTVDNFIAWKRKTVITKADLLARCNEELTTMHINGSDLAFKIQWAFNNIPTEIEWERKGGGYLIGMEARLSAVTGPIVILSFGTVKHINAAWSN